MLTSIFNLKRLVLTLAGSLMALIMLAAVPASAQNTNELCGGANLSFIEKAQDCNRDAQGDVIPEDQRSGKKVNNLLDNIVNLISIIVGIVAVIMIIYGGFRYITSGGDSSKLTDARNTIIYAIVGLIIVAFAQLIVKFVLARIS